MKLTLSRTKFSTFLACQRRFELRYLQQLAWPQAPLLPEAILLQERGQQFHQLVERHFLGLAIEPGEINDVRLRNWWLAFQGNNPVTNLQSPISNLQLMPELSLTIPVGEHLLNGRFDLLATTETQAHIFDWKTGKAQPDYVLRDDWQTRLYLAMIAGSGDALGAPFAPEQIAITYWYVSEPDAPRTIQYDAEWHVRNWAEIELLVDAIDQSANQQSWPLTEDREQCRLCAYQAFCGRYQGETAVSLLDEDAELEETINWHLEPETP